MLNMSNIILWNVPFSLLLVHVLLDFRMADCFPMYGKVIRSFCFTLSRNPGIIRFLLHILGNRYHTNWPFHLVITQFIHYLCTIHNLVHFCTFMISVALVQDVPPLDLGEIFAYFLKQSVPLFDQLGIKRGEMLYFYFVLFYLFSYSYNV